VFAGIGLVLVVLILFLGSARSALIVGVTIPFAMVVAFILMSFTNISANLLSLVEPVGCGAGTTINDRRYIPVMDWICRYAANPAVRAAAAI
jgi:hypothetical protein